ncbi:MAG: LacI family DNA-binding transcriptional regulator [Ruminiclostridium sp.]
MSIKKIAEIAGVSYSTVSRVLSNPEYKCSADGVRERIFAAARELNYIPNEAAKNLKLGIKGEQAPYKISIIVTRTEAAGIDPFFREIAHITESEIHKNMCIVSQVLHLPDLSEDGVDINAGAILSGVSDGLVVIGKCSTVALKTLKKSFKAIVSINRNSTNYESDEVICDGAKIAALAVQYLIGLGHRKIGYVGDCHNESRFKGYRDTLFRYNLDYDIDFVIDTRQGEEQGYEVMERLMQQKNVPTGIYCANDITAVGMLNALSRHKNRYYNPSIISSDDIEEAQFTKPMLTTVRLPKEDMVKFAVLLLLDRLKGGHKATARVELEGTLIVRESCSHPSSALDCEYYI